MSLSIIDEFKVAYRNDKATRVMIGILLCLLAICASTFFLIYDRVFNTQAWQEYVQAEVRAMRMSSDGKPLYTDPETNCVYFMTGGREVGPPRIGKDGRVMGCDASSRLHP